MSDVKKENGFLIFKRRVGESVVIHHGLVEIIVLKITDTQVQIAIKAPREVEVHRKETLKDKGPCSKESPNNNANE